MGCTALQGDLSVVAKYAIPLASKPLDGDPLVKVLACGVLDAVQAGKEGATNTYRSIVDRHLFGVVCLVDVFLPDGTEQQLVYYRDSTSVLDAVAQLAWTVGGQDPQQYTLYNDRGSGCVPLNKRKTLADSMLEELEQSHGSQQKLIFKKRFSRVTKEEKENPSCAATSFVHWREHYLHMNDEIHPSFAVLLCVLQIQANHDPPDLGQHQALAEFVDKWMPEHVPKSVSFILGIVFSLCAV